LPLAILNPRPKEFIRAGAILFRSGINFKFLIFNSSLKSCIIIAGPTASGKTSLAISIAKYFNTEIISADSRQCYKELNIGVARPSEEELSEVPHHFIASHSIQENFSAADYERYALDKVQELFQRQDTVVMVGGTGLYIKAFCEGLDEIPASDEKIRQDIIRQYEEKGMGWLQEMIKENDPGFFASGEIHNPQRVMRALEVKLATGSSITSMRSGQKKKRDFSIIKAAIEMPREILYDRINLRVDEMIEAGLLKEVESLMPYKHLNALQTVGYKELFSYLDNEITLPRAIELIKQNTRHYAKRQMTWFKKDEEFTWGSSEELKGKLRMGKRNRRF